ncbi:MAG: ABC transporter substrate-binding protein [Pseudomonadota bacterium]
MRSRQFLFIFFLGVAFVLSTSLSCFAADKVIKIGVASSLQKEAGIGAKNGSIMAAEEINAAGGILGHKIECFFADDEARPEVGIRAVKKLIFEDKVDIMSGGWLSGVGLAEADHIFNAKKLWLSSGPATPKLAEMVKQNYERAKYFFRLGVVNSDNFGVDVANFTADFFKGKLGVTKIALLPESSVWAREVDAMLQKLLPEKGLQIVFTDVFDPKRTDFSPQFASVRSSGAGAIITIQAAFPGVPMTKQWAETEVPCHLGGYNMAAQSSNYWEKTGGKCLGEITLMANGARAPISPNTIPFHDKYVEQFKMGPTYTSYGQYDALYILKAAAEKAQSLDTDKLIKVLEKIDFLGVAGRIRYTKYHDEIYGPEGKRCAWIQWQGDKKQEVIYPDDWATAKYMTPPWLKKK